MSEGELLNRALALHQQGRLADAERLYLAAIEAAPQDAAAPHLLGVVRAQQGRNREALELMARGAEAQARCARNSLQLRQCAEDRRALQPKPWPVSTARLP